MATNSPGPKFRVGSAFKKAYNESPNPDGYAGSGIAFPGTSVATAASATARSITDTSKAAFTPTTAGYRFRKVLSDVNEKAKDVVPYLSNAVNALRKPPAPIKGKMVSPATLNNVDYSAERNSVDRDVRSANLAATQGLDSQGAAAVAGANIARGFEARGASFAKETQANTAIGNQRAGMQFQADAMNAGKEDQYNQDVIGMKMAHQREQSQNISNFSDKQVASQNADAARKLDIAKFNVLSDVYSNGIIDRLTDRTVKRNEGATNSVLGVKANGGSLRKVYGDGGGLQPGPKYRMSTLRDASKEDSASYLRNFNSYMNQDPIAVKQAGVFAKYGIPMNGPGGVTDKGIYATDTETNNAYEDAEAQLNANLINGIKKSPAYFGNVKTKRFGEGGPLAGDQDWAKRTFPGLTIQGLKSESAKLGTMMDPKSPPPVLARKRELLDNEVAKRQSGTAYKAGASVGSILAGRKLADGGPITGPGSNASTYKTQAEVDAANAKAKAFAARQFSYQPGAVKPEDTYVATRPGDPVVPVVGKDGQPFKAVGSDRPVAYSVPNWVTADDLKPFGDHYGYEDRSTGRWVDVHSSVIGKFKNATPAPGSVAKMALGGKLGHMRGRIRKAY